MIFSSSLTYVTHLAPPGRRAEAIGTLGAAAFLGIVIGPYLGELVLSTSRTRDEFETLFVGGAVLLLLPVSLVMLIRPAETEPGQGSIRLGEFLKTARRHWPGMVVMMQITFGLCVTVPFVFLTKFVDDTGLVDTGFSKVSLFFMCYAGWGLTLRIVFRRTPDRIGRRKVLLVGAVAMSLGMLSFLVVDPDHSMLIVVPALLCGTGHSLMYHTCTSLFLDSFPTDVRGAGSGLSMVALDIGSVGGAQLLGEVAHRFGYDLLFVIVAGVALVAASIYAVSSVPVWRAATAGVFLNSPGAKKEAPGCPTRSLRKKPLTNLHSENHCHRQPVQHRRQQPVRLRHQPGLPVPGTRPNQNQGST